ncbi:hypothetical protein ACQRIU_002094 [Beauveria bassiana]
MFLLGGVFVLKEDVVFFKAHTSVPWAKGVSADETTLGWCLLLRAMLQCLADCLEQCDDLCRGALKLRDAVLPVLIPVSIEKKQSDHTAVVNLSVPSAAEQMFKQSGGEDIDSDFALDLAVIEIIQTLDIKARFSDPSLDYRYLLYSDLKDAAGTRTGKCIKSAQSV